MGYVTRNTRRPWLLADFETTACREIDQFEEDVRVDSRLKDPDKIADARRAALEKVATDIDLARIVCTGLWASHDDGPTVLVGDDEEAQLRAFWSAYESVVVERGGLLVGYNLLGFDCPLAMRRAQLLDLPYTPISLYKYKVDKVYDLQNELSFQGAKPFRSQNFYCRRFGIDIPDPTTGADMPAAIAAGDWATVRAHNLADLQKVKGLAQRLRVIGPSVTEAAA